MERSNWDAAQEDEDTVLINVPEDLLSAMRASCAEKASVSLLGRIQGKHPGLKALTAWARDTLHPTLSLLALKANNLFEVTFSSIEGRTHALTQADLTCETASISFSSWKPHFDAKTQQDQDQLDFPIWMQVVDLCHVMREETFLRNIGEHIGQVIAIDNSELYRAKLFGPRIQVLVKDLNKLPRNIAVPRLDREGVVKHKIEYSGFPNQCGRCRSRDHHVRNCPKKEAKTPRRTQDNQPTHNDDDTIIVSNVLPSPSREPEQQQQEVMETIGDKHIRGEGESTPTGLRAPALRPNPGSKELPNNHNLEVISDTPQPASPLETEVPDPPPQT
jgi:hypothetical protein